LQLDLLATQRRRGGQCCDQVETLHKLSDSFNQSGALGAQVVSAPMRGSIYESDNAPWSKTLALRAVRTVIGQELGAHYEVPQDLPYRILTLLKQLSEQEGRDSAGRCDFYAIGHNKLRAR
jgi:hypothetical protein